MISQWNYQCTHQIPGKMGAYFIQFKVVRLNWLTAIENFVNLVNSSLILTPFFFAKIYLRHVVRQSSRSVWSFLCMTDNQDTALSSTAHNHIFFLFLLKCWNDLHIQTCGFFTFRNWLQLCFSGFHTHAWVLFFFLHMALICQEASGKTASRLVPVKNGLLFVQAMSCSVKITRFAFWTAALSWV